MPTTNSRVADAQGIDDFIGFYSHVPLPIFNLFFEVFKIFALPTFYLIEFVDNCSSECFVANILSNVSRSKESSIFVTILFSQKSSLILKH